MTTWLRHITALLLLTATTASTAPLIELGPCPSEIGIAGAECGTLEVFENRDTNTGRKIALNIAVLPAFSHNPEPDPLFAFAGGPGAGSTELADMANSAMRRIREKRDIVLVDQRGTGKSNPLDCELIDPDSTLFVADSEQLVLEQLRQCLDEFDADVRLYTTPIAMDDIDDVRQALGYERINLWGGSYGTRAALIYMRRHPQHVRAVILDGLAPTAIALPLNMGIDAQRALDLLQEACAADLACKEAFGDIGAKFDAVLTRLESGPIWTHIEHPRTGDSIEVPVNRFAVAAVVRGSLYSAEQSAVLPLVIERAYQGDFGPLAALSEPFAKIEEKMSAGLLYSVLCSEDVTRTAPEDRPTMPDSFFGPFALDLFDKVCAFWPRGELPAAYYEPVATDHSTLVLSGNLDPVTPPRWGEETSRHLKNARHIVVPGVGHGATHYGCVPQLMAEFIDTGHADNLDVSCVEELRRPPFFHSFIGPQSAATKTSTNETVHDSD